MNAELKQAVDVLCKALNKDKSEGSYYHSWQANIAMAFKDEYERIYPNTVEHSKMVVHQIANNAAKNFLDILSGPVYPIVSENNS